MVNIGNHIMLDLETMGNTSQSAIISIGAVRFDIITGDIGDKFYNRISLKSCLDYGMSINADTILWWMEQNEEARKEFTQSESVHINQALSNFSKFITKEDFIWGNSARFDCGILKDAYDVVKLICPWDFRKELDVRTLVFLAPEFKCNHIHKGSEHKSIDDCINQIEYCSKIFNNLSR